MSSPELSLRAACAACDLPGVRAALAGAVPARAFVAAYAAIGPGAAAGEIAHLLRLDPRARPVLEGLVPPPRPLGSPPH